MDPDIAIVTIPACQGTSEDGTSIWVDDLSFGLLQSVQEKGVIPVRTRHGPHGTEPR